MKRLLVVMALVAPPLLACTCAEQSLDRAFERATAVFTGRVIAVRPGRPGSADIEVLGIHKGRRPASGRLRVATGGAGTACGYAFEKGQSYLVWASGKSDALRTNLCTPTKRLASAQSDLAWLLRRSVAR